MRPIYCRRKRCCTFFPYIFLWTGMLYNAFLSFWRWILNWDAVHGILFLVDSEFYIVYPSSWSSICRWCTFFTSVWSEMLYLYLKRNVVNDVPTVHSHGVWVCTWCSILVRREVLHDNLLYLVWVYILYNVHCTVYIKYLTYLFF